MENLKSQKIQTKRQVDRKKVSATLPEKTTEIKNDDQITWFTLTNIKVFTRYFKNDVTWKNVIILTGVQNACQSPFVIYLIDFKVLHPSPTYVGQ